MPHDILRRAALGAMGASVTCLAGCLGAPGTDGPVLQEGFESPLEGWRTRASIGPEEPLEAFEWRVERSREQAHAGEWSLEVFTEGDHDDGTAWAVREISLPADAAGVRVSLQAWSASESFNTLRHLVSAVRPTPPRDEGGFPDPGANSTGIAGAAYGGLREPLHQAEGWREYAFEWRPETLPSRAHLAVGVSVVWEADATHYLDDIEVTALD